MTKRLLLLLAALTILATSAPPSATALTTSWQKKLGADLASVAVSPTGAIYVAGSRLNGTFETKALLAKLTPAGDVVWTRTWLPSNKLDRATGFPFWSTRATAVTVADDGTIYVTGFVEKTNCEGGGWFIRKYGPSGKLLHAFGRYQKTKLAQCTLTPQFTSDIAARGKLVVVAGQDFGCCDDPATDGWVRAFNARLRPRWKAQFEPPASTPSAWFDTADGVAIGSGGNVFAGGWASTGPPPSDTVRFTGIGAVVLEKFDATGGVLWTRTAGPSMFAGSGVVGVAAHGDRVMLSAAIDGTGVWWGSSKRTRAWLGRFKPGGSLVWSRTWGLRKKAAAEPTGVAVDASKSTWVVGTRRDPSDHGLDVFVRRFGPGGASLGGLSFDAGVRRLIGGGIAPRGTSAYVTGSATAPSSGLVWRVTG
jgi:hypothetical protein